MSRPTAEEPHPEAQSAVARLRCLGGLVRRSPAYLHWVPRVLWCFRSAPQYRGIGLNQVAR